MQVRTARWIGCLVGIVLISAVPLSAGSLRLAWNASDGATAYRVYYGPDSGQYTNSVNVGNVTQATINGLGNCSTWHFAVTASNGAGESGHSNEVANWPRPAVSNASPSTAMQGDQLTVRLNGANYQAGATVEIDNPNVFLTGVAVISCTEIEAVATVEPMAAGVRPAEIGPVTFTVDNPDGLSVETQPFTVLVDPSRFDINRDDPATSDRIDGRDTVWLSRRFGGEDGDNLYHPDYDFDGDGWIDGNDLHYIVSNLGGCWNGSGWTTSACQN